MIGESAGGHLVSLLTTDRAYLAACGLTTKAICGAIPISGVFSIPDGFLPAVFGAWGRKASPLSHVDRLARPLLVLHGTSDVNVPYLHSVRLIDELLKRGKGDLVSFMTYPGEFHYFTRDHVLRDAWHRVDDFFGEHLVGSPKGPRYTSQPQ